MEDKRLNFSDSKIKFENISIDEDMIDIYLLYNGEIVNSLKSGSKNFHRIITSEIGISKEYQQLVFELVNKIELTIKIKISNKMRKEISFKSRLKMFNKKPETKKIKDSKKDEQNKNNKIDNIITEEEKEDKINIKDMKEEIIKIWKMKNTENINQRLTLECKNEKENKTSQIINEYELKINELQSIINQKEKEIKELLNKLNNEKEIISILNKIREPLITIKKENEYQIINNIKKPKPELIQQSINDNKIQLLGSKNDNKDKDKSIFQLSHIDKFFIEKEKLPENKIESKDKLEILKKDKNPLKITNYDNFTIEKKKKVENVIEKKDKIQLLSQEEEKKELKLNINKIEKRDSIELLLNSINKKENKEEEKGNFLKILSKKINSLQYMKTNDFIIKENEKPKNEIQLSNNLEILKNKKPKVEDIKSSKWVTEINNNNKFELLGIKKIENNRNSGKHGAMTNTEEEGNDIKMTISNKDNKLYNYEKVKLDEKNGGRNNNMCDGCFIY